jgi:hypothetical protein
VACWTYKWPQISGQVIVLSPTSDGLTVGFQRVPGAKTGKNRLHLDLMVEDLDAAPAEIEAPGERWLEPGRTNELEGFQWRVMADPGERVRHRRPAGGMTTNSSRLA